MKKKQGLFILSISFIILLIIWGLRNNITTEISPSNKNNKATQRFQNDERNSKPEINTDTIQSLSKQLNTIDAQIIRAKSDYRFDTLQEILNDPYYKYSFNDLELLAKSDDFRAQQILVFRLANQPPLNYQNPLKRALPWAKIGAFKNSYVSQALLANIYALQNDVVTAHAFNTYFSDLGNPLTITQMKSDQQYLTPEELKASEKLLRSGTLQEELNKYQNISSTSICEELGTCK